MKLACLLVLLSRSHPRWEGRENLLPPTPKTAAPWALVAECIFRDRDRASCTKEAPCRRFFLPLICLILNCTRISEGDIAKAAWVKERNAVFVVRQPIKPRLVHRRLKISGECAWLVPRTAPEIGHLPAYTGPTARVAPNSMLQIEVCVCACAAQKDRARWGCWGLI
jgi:hypothetical protein